MKKAIIPLLIWLATVGVFWRIQGHDYFELDDGAHTYENPRIHPPSLEGLRRHWRHPYMGLYVPITFTVWSAESYLAEVLGTPTVEGRPDPRFFHLGNIALHATNAVLVYFILASLFSPSLAGPLLGALLFALHPVQVEPVAWISGLKDVLSTFFGLLSIVAYLGFLRKKEKTRWIGYGAAFVCFLFGILAKPSLVALPLLLLALEAGLFRRSAWASLGRLAPWALCAVPLVVLTKKLQPLAQNAIHLGWWARLRVALDALGFYVGKYSFPLSLAPDYGRTPTWVLEHGSPWLSALPVALLAWAIALKRRRFWLTVLLVYLGGGIVTVLGLIPFDFQNFSTVADRYSYFSLFALALGAAFLVTRVKEPLVSAAFALALACLGMRTIVQEGHWRNTDSILDHTLAANPKSGWAHNILGKHLIAKGRIDEGLAFLRQAANDYPAWLNFRYELGTKLMQAKRYGEAKAEFLTLTRREPNEQVFQWSLAVTEYRAGDSGKAVEALTHITLERLRVDATNLLGVAYFKSGAVALALETFRDGSRRFPDHREFFLNWGMALERSGRPEEALSVYRQYLDKKPDALVRDRLALALSHLGRWDEAAEQYHKVIVFSRATPVRRARLGDALLRSGHLKEAMAEYERALQMDKGFQAARLALERAREGKPVAALVAPAGETEWAQVPAQEGT